MIGNMTDTLQRPSTRISTAATSDGFLSHFDDAGLLLAASMIEYQEQAVRELYARYRAPLFAFLLRRLPDRSSAEEALQETFLRLWRAADRYDERRGSVAALLFTTARNVATDALRRHARRPSSRWVVGELADLEGNPVAEGPEVGMTVVAAMQRLPAAHREVLDLAYWGDMTQAQIADVLRIPLGTVKSRVFLALKGLRVELAAAGLVA